MLLLVSIMLFGLNSQAHTDKIFGPPTQTCMIPIFGHILWPAVCADSKKEPLRDIPSRVLNWGSNGLGGMPWCFSDKSCNDFIINLAQMINIYNPGIRLSPHDLFHAHMINYELNAMALVFHAKEYPADLEKAKIIIS